MWQGGERIPEYFSTQPFCRRKFSSTPIVIKVVVLPMQTPSKQRFVLLLPGPPKKASRPIVSTYQCTKRPITLHPNAATKTECYLSWTLQAFCTGEKGKSKESGKARWVEELECCHRRSFFRSPGLCTIPEGDVLPECPLPPDHQRLHDAGSVSRQHVVY